VAVVTRLRRPPSREEFAAVVEQHLDAVHGYLRYLTGDRDLADDLTAEAFERAYTGWRRFDPDRGGVRTWLCQIARSRALDHFRSEERRRRREGVYALGEPEAVESAFGEGLSPQLEAALARLSPGEREVVALRVVLELDGLATARLLGISETACSTRLSRALKKLEEEVERNAVA
jgi:RNA polymerase sigma-70 factor (ECF subfamily)